MSDYLMVRFGFQKFVIRHCFKLCTKPKSEHPKIQNFNFFQNHWIRVLANYANYKHCHVVVPFNTLIQWRSQRGQTATPDKKTNREGKSGRGRKKREMKEERRRKVKDKRKNRKGEENKYTRCCHKTYFHFLHTLVIATFAFLKMQ